MESTARASGRRRRLPLQLRQRRVDARPARGRRRPYGDRGIGEVRVVERADAHEDQVRPRLRLAEQRRPARRAEAPVHAVPAAGVALIVAGLARHLERFGKETGVDRSASRAEILAVPAPAHPRDNRRRSAFPSNRAADTPARDRHGILH